MSFSSLNKSIVLFASSLLLIGCGGSGQPVKNSLDSMTPEQRSAQIQKTFDNQMEKNKEAMDQQQIMTPPEGVGFQQPESMKKYMNKGAGGTGAGGTGAGGTGAGGTGAGGTGAGGTGAGGTGAGGTSPAPKNP